MALCYSFPKNHWHQFQIPCKCVHVTNLLLENSKGLLTQNRHHLCELHHMNWHSLLTHGLKVAPVCWHLSWDHISLYTLWPGSGYDILPLSLAYYPHSVLITKSDSFPLLSPPLTRFDILTTQPFWLIHPCFYLKSCKYSVDATGNIQCQSDFLRRGFCLVFPSLDILIC